MIAMSVEWQMQYTNKQEKGDRYMKWFNEQKNSLRKISCAKHKKQVLKEMRRLYKKGEGDSQRYEELVDVLFELKAYERYFERPSTIWVQTCQDRFYSYLFAREEARKKFDKIDWFLKYRIAASVAQNRGFTPVQFNRREFH